MNTGKHQLQNSLRRLRFQLGEMTQQYLAARVGVSRQTIISIEKGKYKPSVELALLIAGVFKVSVEEVFYIQENDKE